MQKPLWHVDAEYMTALFFTIATELFLLREIIWKLDTLNLKE